MATNDLTPFKAAQTFKEWYRRADGFEREHLMGQLTGSSDLRSVWRRTAAACSRGTHLLSVGKDELAHLNTHMEDVQQGRSCGSGQYREPDAH